MAISPNGRVTVSLIKATVVKIDAEKSQIKVKFEQFDNMVSGWLDILQANASGYQIYSMPTKGARVFVDMDANLEEGVLVGGYYDKNNKPPSTSAGALHIKGADGSEILLDGGDIKIKVPGKVDIESAGDIDIKVSGVVNIESGSDINIKVPGKVNIESGGDTIIKGSNIILDGNVFLGGAAASIPVEGSGKVKTVP